MPSVAAEGIAAHRADRKGWCHQRPRARPAEEDEADEAGGTVKAGWRCGVEVCLPGVGSRSSGNEPLGVGHTSITQLREPRQVLDAEAVR